MFKRIRISSFLSIVLISLITVLAVSCDSGSTTTLDIQATNGGSAPKASAVPARSASPLATGSLSVSVPVIDVSGLEAGYLELTKAFIAVKEIEIEMKGQDDDESEITGSFLVDLLNNNVTPSFPAISLPDGEYDEIEFEIDKLTGVETDSSGNPLVSPGDEMYGKSLYLAGNYVWNGNSVPFEFSTALEGEIKMKDAESINSFALTGNTEFVIAFRMDKWFAFNNDETNPDQLDFSLLNGKTTISLLLDILGIATDESRLMEVILENIEESADFGIDEDRDGVLEEDEDDD